MCHNSPRHADGDLPLESLAWTEVASQAADAARYFAEHLLPLAVRGMRDGGSTWEQVAEAVGLASRQAAYERFGK